MDNIFETEDKIYSILGLEKCGFQISKNLYVPNIKRGNKNILVIGEDEKEKAENFIVPNILNCLGSYVIIDKNGENYEKTHKHLEENGYKVYRITDGFNFFSCFTCEEDVDALVEVLVKNTSTEIFWDMSAKSLLKSIIYYVKAVTDDNNQIKLFKECLSNDQATLNARISMLPISHPARVSYSSIEQVGEKTYGSIMATLFSNINFIMSKIVWESLNKNQIDIYDFFDEKKVALFIERPFENMQYKSYTNISIDYILYLLFNNLNELKKNKKNDIYFILDEFDSFNKFEYLSDRIIQSNDNSTYFILMARSIDKLKEIYKGNLDIILSCCDTQIYNSSNLVSNKEYFCKLLNVDRTIIDKLSLNEMIIYEKGLKPIICKNNK